MFLTGLLSLKSTVLLYLFSSLFSNVLFDVVCMLARFFDAEIFDSKSLCKVFMFKLQKFNVFFSTASWPFNREHDLDVVCVFDSSSAFFNWLFGWTNSFVEQNLGANFSPFKFDVESTSLS